MVLNVFVMVNREALRLSRYWILDTIIDTVQKTSDSISTFLILVEWVKFQLMSQKKHLGVGWGR